MFNPQPKSGKSIYSKQWARVRDREVVPQFKRWGINNCEITFPHDCTGLAFAGFAHSKKARDVKTYEDLVEVILACGNGHHQIEYFCKENTGMTMTEYVKEVIKNRTERLCKLGLMQNTKN